MREWKKRGTKRSCHPGHPVCGDRLSHTEQLTSAIGALGAIAGYLFGRATAQTAGGAEQREG